MKDQLLIVAGLLLVIWVAACSRSETVFLRNQAGDVVQCGPYMKGGNAASAHQTMLLELRFCVEDYQRQGYERIPEGR